MTTQQFKTKENLALWVGLALLGLGAFALMSFSKKTTPPSDNSEEEPTPSSKCTEGERPCENGSGKCYNPNANYAVDPCRF